MSYAALVFSTNVAGLADLPTIQANPTPEDICEKLLQLIPRQEAVGNDQMNIVRNTFNMKNWQNAWEKVIMAVKENR